MSRSNSRGHKIIVRAIVSEASKGIEPFTHIRCSRATNWFSITEIIQQQRTKRPFTSRKDEIQYSSHTVTRLWCVYTHICFDIEKHWFKIKVIETFTSEGTHLAHWSSNLVYIHFWLQRWQEYRNRSWFDRATVIGDNFGKLMWVCRFPLSLPSFSFLSPFLISSVSFPIPSFINTPPPAMDTTFGSCLTEKCFWWQYLHQCTILKRFDGENFKTEADFDWRSAQT